MNNFARKINALLVLKKAYRKIVETGKQNEGSEIMYRKIQQLTKELYGQPKR